jgi:hypothetical protein
MRILLTTYHQAFLVRGGGEYEIQSIADDLRQMGMIADIYGPFSRPIEYYDIVLHFSMHSGGLGLLYEIAARKKPIILWTNLWTNSPSIESINSIKEHLHLATFVTFKSQSELNHAANIVDIDSSKIRICRTVADASYLKKAPVGLFQDIYGVDKYALGIGIIEPNKNQLSAIRATRLQEVPLILVGRYRDLDYYQKCKKEGGDNVMFIDALPQKSEIVRSAFQSASFFIEVSLEPPGLSSLEAGLSGAKLVLSDMDWTREHFKKYAQYVNPHSVSDIQEGMNRSLLEKKNPFVQKHLIEYCFPKSIKPLVALFDELINK